MVIGGVLTMTGNWSVATFAFMGSELVGVTVGEAQNPRKNIPRGIRTIYLNLTWQLLNWFSGEFWLYVPTIQPYTDF